MTSERAVALKKIADELRLDVIHAVHNAGDGHPGPALSMLDILTVLYFEKMRLDPARPEWGDRDRFILSKGHSCPGLYAALARLGYFDKKELDGLRSLGSILQGHPVKDKTPGVDMTSGSLGNGLPVATGMAIGGRYLKKDFYTYVIAGDGEIEEGIVWEGAMAAVKHKLDHLILFIDHNGFQSGGTCAECSGILPIPEKFASFGWHVQVIDGHDHRAISDAVDRAKEEKGRPSVIVAMTVKGKGVSYMENNNDWHKGVPTEEQVAVAERELGGED
jgi:transketolase